ncbi:hypothetical protein ACL02P_08620 [Paenibacillus sp. MB22_1]|uniref:hypothetical protein n=1 Tax=Paenibacillus sp. MB22_1 TaxID=3383121 RepID=UPI0039A0F53D
MAAALVLVIVTACQSNEKRLTVVDPGTHQTGQQQPVQTGVEQADTKRQLTVVDAPRSAGREFASPGRMPLRIEHPVLDFGGRGEGGKDPTGQTRDSDGGSAIRV